MLVVQTRTRVPRIPAQVRTRVRAVVRMLRKRIQGQDNGGESMSNEKHYPLHPNQSHPPIMTCEIPLEEYESLKRENAELKAKLEDVHATAYAESVDAGMENRKLKRALWLARAERARDNSILLPSKFMRNVWENVERKCRAKAEEYK